MSSWCPVPTADRQLDSTYYKAMAVGSSTNLIPFVSRRYVRDLTTGATGTYVLGVAGVANNVNVSYDPNELIERYRDYPASVRHSFAYTPRHEVAQSFYNAANLDAAFGRTYAFRDSLGRVTSMSWSLGPDTTNVRSFRFNDRGELVRLADSTVAAATCSFAGQDLLDGLSCTGGTAWPTRVLTFAYDSAGNLTGESDSLASTTTTATYTPGNRLTAFGATTYTLDDDGNLASRTTGGVTTYFTYDGQSRLASVRVGADTTFYWYNANGELTVRARNNNSGTNVRTIERLFFWDGGQLVAETDAAMTTRYGEYAYLPGADRPLALITTDSSVSGNTLVRYYQQDELGNVIGLTSGSAVAQQITYEPWGAVAALSGTVGDTSRLRWKGLVWEGGATQLYYVRNRWYDPEARRFVSQDPIGVEGGLNQYAFAGNDPVNYADPLGLHSQYRSSNCSPGLQEELTIDMIAETVTSACVGGGGGGVFFTRSNGLGAGYRGAWGPVPLLETSAPAASLDTWMGGSVGASSVSQASVPDAIFAIEPNSALKGCEEGPLRFTRVGTIHVLGVAGDALYDIQVHRTKLGKLGRRGHYAGSAQVTSLVFIGKYALVTPSGINCTTGAGILWGYLTPGR